MKRLLFLFICATIGSILIGLLLQTDPYLKGIDGGLYVFLTSHFHNHTLDLLIAPFNFNWVDWAGPLPTYLYILIFGCLTYLFFFDRKNIFWAALAFTIGGALAYLITFLDMHFVFRVRPFVAYPGNIIGELGRQAWEKLSSFPSGHTRETTLFSVITWKFVPHLKPILIIFIVFITYSRVYLGAHYPTDALAGVLIGYVVAKLTLAGVSEMKRTYRNDKKKSAGEANL